MTALGSFENLVTRLDTKFGLVNTELSNKMSFPDNVGAFNPSLIDLSGGQKEYDLYIQSSPMNFTLDPSKTPSSGGAVLVNIRGGGFGVTFSSPFVGLGEMFSGAVLKAGVQYPFAFKHAPDWVETSPGIFADRVLIQADGLAELAAALAYEPSNF